MTIWSGSSYVWFGIEGEILRKLLPYRYDYDDEYHITTHFLTKGPLLLHQSIELFPLIRQVAELVLPIELPLTEFASFGDPTNPARVAKFAAPPAMYRWRTRLAASIENHGIPLSKDWPWDPHMTYAYGFSQERRLVDLVEKELLRKETCIKIVSLCAFDGRAKLEVKL